MTIPHRPGRLLRGIVHRNVFPTPTTLLDPERRSISPVDLLDLANAVRLMAAATPSDTIGIDDGVRAVVAEVGSARLALIHATLAALHDDLVRGG